MKDASPEELRWVMKEMERLETSGAIAEVPDSQWVSKLFMVPKPPKLNPETGLMEPNYRLIWDGRELNRACGKADGYKMETLKNLKYLARKGDWMLSADLQDGFHALGIHEDHTKFMSFQIGGRTYCYQVLPFGWTESPRCFCRLMETLTRALRSPDLPHYAAGSQGLLRALKAG